jgi:hypothetical protein
LTGVAGASGFFAPGFFASDSFAAGFIPSFSFNSSVSRSHFASFSSISF